MATKFINNVNFNYELLGASTTNPPLVFIAGYACDINFWRPLAEKIATNRQVLIFDHQGIGKTEDDNQPLSATIMANNIKLLIDALGLTIMTPAI